MKNRKPDQAMIDTKRPVQDASRALVKSGALAQQDVFLISPAKARRAVVILKA